MTNTLKPLDLLAFTLEGYLERGWIWAEEITSAFGDPIDVQRLRAAVVADSPELAQANERIAALEGQVDSALKTIIAANETADMLLQQRTALVIERDAALARVAELEALVAEMQKPDPLQEKIDALTRRVLDAAQPKPRDESVPAPGFFSDPDDPEHPEYPREGT